jgi:hypothetical protein
MKNLFDKPETLANLSEVLPMMLDELVSISANNELDRAEDAKATIVALFGEVIDAAIAGMENLDR